MSVTEGLVIAEVLIAGVQAGLALVLAAALLRSSLPRAERACGVLAALAYLMNCLINSPAGDFVERPSAVFTAVAVYSATAGGLLWVMVMALFDDRPVRPAMLLPALAVALLVLLMLLTSGPVEAAAWWFANLTSLLIFLHALYILARGRAADLVETRRRLRRPLAATCIALGAAQVAALAAAGRAPWIRNVAALAEAAGLLLLAAVMIELRGSLFEAPQARRTSDEAEGALDAALDKVMSEEAAWRDEGFSIGVLAARLGAPEHRLRRLINRRRGFRNFAAFVNSYRIEAAKQRLSDPRFRDSTVAAIAFDLGFNSLSPFNRAFKDATGLTPTAWRRRPHADGI